MPIIDAAIDRYAHDRTRVEPALLAELAADTRAQKSDAGMLTGKVEGRLLTMLARMIGAKRVLELGTFTGYSALSLAEGLPDDGTVISCDIDPQAKEFASRYIARSQHARKISILIGPALATLETLPGPFDLVFIDADKENYARYYEAVVPKVRGGGLIVVDNALWSGKILDPKDDSSRAIDTLNRMIERDARVENVLLTVRDGVHLARKR